MFLSDIAIFYMFAQKNERLKGRATSEVFNDVGMYLLQRSGIKNLETFFNKIKGSDLFIQ